MEDEFVMYVFTNLSALASDTRSIFKGEFNIFFLLLD